MNVANVAAMILALVRRGLEVGLCVSAAGLDEKERGGASLWELVGEEGREDSGDEERGEKSAGLSLLNGVYEKPGPLPRGVMVEERVAGLKSIPLRRLLLILKGGVVGVCGGEEGCWRWDCWAKFSFLGVDGRMFGSFFFCLLSIKLFCVRNYCLRYVFDCVIVFSICVLVKAVMPAVDISSKEKEVEGDCSS